MWTAGSGCKKPSNRNVPKCIVEALRAVRRWAMQNHRAVLASGYSRGGKWLLQVACRHASLIDYALVLAGYPSNKDYSVQISEARAILEVPVPVDIFQYQTDIYCKPALYPYWVQVLQNSNSINTRYKLMQGGHEAAREHFADTNQNMYARFWNTTSLESRGLLV